ncbi:putative ser arg-related nuclear matrix protein [Diaporthe ampelina]|uniref:Putative ser arg-related nuclear matrix protein n=1 Tax=Diaporthe ampelina TaxID=1214573 RepID=A0A0G2H4F5_9PEZI|nr:putative ser arg-related nuclear matrix protein [Diaporthe ampelina]
MKRPSIGYTNWLTLSRCDNFTICLSCYEQVFYPTEFRDLFLQAPYRFREKELSTDLRLLQGVVDVLSKEKVPCHGNTRVTRMWYSITDPDTRRCIPDFRVCSPCAKAVETLFPSLMGVFAPKDRQAEPKPGRCSLHFMPNRNRFLTYFDVFEKCHDVAMETKSAPDVQRLADNINFWASVDECPRDDPLRNAEWYIMASIPEMTVCNECFLDVVFPELVADVEANTVAGSERRSVARDFYRDPTLIEATTEVMAGVRETFLKLGAECN